MAFKQRQALAETQAKEHRVQEAVAESKRRTSSPYKAAKMYNVSESIVRRRLSGAPPRSTISERMQSLSNVEEEGLSLWVEQRGILGWAPSKQEVEKRASLIAGKPISKGWFYRYLKRHPEFIYKSIKKQTAARLWSLTLPKVDAFFDLVSQQKPWKSTLKVLTSSAACRYDRGVQARREEHLRHGQDAHTPAGRYKGRETTAAAGKAS